jgi:hypothetical protein
MTTKLDRPKEMPLGIISPTILSIIVVDQCSPAFTLGRLHAATPGVFPPDSPFSPCPYPTRSEQWQNYVAGWYRDLVEVSQHDADLCRHCGNYVSGCDDCYEGSEFCPL